MEVLLAQKTLMELTNDHREVSDAPCVDKSRLAIICRGMGAEHWLSELLENGEAPGWSLVYALAPGDNNASADDIIEAMLCDRLIVRGDEAHDFSQDAFLTAHAGFWPKHIRFNREFMWHLAEGASDFVYYLMELAQNRCKRRSL